MMRMAMIFMLLASGWVSAQEDEDQKDQSEEDTRRPSWSSGLPERQKPGALQRPDLSNELKDSLTIDRSELGLERPEVDYSVPEEDVQESAETEQSEQQEAKPVIAEPVIEEEAVDEQPVAETPVIAVEPEPEPEPVIYDWVVINQTDVEYPSQGVNNQISGWVDVEVTLNPQGDVVSAKAVDFSDNADIYVEAAEDSMSGWVFQAPQEQGVSDLVSKTYRIDFVPPAIEQDVASEPAEVIEETEPVSQEIAEELNDGSVSNDENYQWRILNRVPLEYPLVAARKRLEGWVDLMVTINAEGEVVDLKESNYSQRGRVFVEPAKDALLQWQFEPPKNQGITQNMSRSYRVEFEL